MRAQTANIGMRQLRVVRRGQKRWDAVGGIEGAPETAIASHGELPQVRALLLKAICRAAARATRVQVPQGAAPA